MNPLVTVAIAAYNVEKYLENGMKSIFQQTYNNIEIILVDDGSTDKTSQICDEMGLRDPRVRVFHKENGGLGSARNVGIENARGMYLYFFDVDDFVEPDFIADSVRLIEEKQVDLLIFGYYARFDSSQEEELIVLTEREIHCNAELKKVYCDELLWMKHGNGFAWNKFYRVSFLRQHSFMFGNQRIQQDEPFNMQLYPKLERVYICSKAYYHYVIYASGNAASRFLLNKADILTDIYHKFMDFYKEWNLDDQRVLKYIKKRYVSGIYGVLVGNYFHAECPYTALQRKKAIQADFMREELNECFKDTRIQYSKNIINTLQAWAFNHHKAQLLVQFTMLKRFILRIVK